jgi:protease I
LSCQHTQPRNQACLILPLTGASGDGVAGTVAAGSGLNQVTAAWLDGALMNSLNSRMNKTLLAFIGDVYEDLELWYPKLRVEEAGFATKLAGEELRTFTSKHGYPAVADLLVAKVRSEDFAGLLIPGGFMPDKLRRNADVLRLTREFHQQGKLVAFICHGGWIPISAKILKGKRATGTEAIKDDLENAGALWVDEPVVIDGNLISSRTPKDLTPFARAMVDFLRK